MNVHKQKIDKEKDTQYIETMDWMLGSDVLLDEAVELKETKPKHIEKVNKIVEKDAKNYKNNDECKTNNIEKNCGRNEKRKRIEISFEDSKETSVKKIKASSTVFCVEKGKIDKQLEGARTASASSGNPVTVTINNAAAKYYNLPSSSAATKPIVRCLAFPLCRFGRACAYSHPRCKFAAACRRRNCMYSHSSQAALARVKASRVVPSVKYKSISAVGTSQCKFYPNCLNPACYFYHPKPCRYGKACLNKLGCYFYHNDVSLTKWKNV